MLKNQLSIISGIIPSTILAAIYVTIVYYFVPLSVPEIYTQGDRLAYALKYEVFEGFMLLLGIANVSRLRFRTPSAIDGSRPEAGSILDVNINYIQNTLEQMCLLIIGHVGLSIVLPVTSLKIIPILVSLFVIARILFWIGFVINPMYRSFGFNLTFAPNTLVILYVMFAVALS